ncbi:MAG: acyl-CoA dehydrogenase family protein, partial [Pseudomonadota bacterium]
MRRPSWETEDMGLFRQELKKFLAREFEPHVDAWRHQGKVDRDAWRKAGEMGMLCAGIGEAYGGIGGTFGHEAVIIEELERIGLGLGFGNTVHSAIVAPYIEAYGSDAQKQRWLPRLASGEFVGAIAMTEPGTGSDLQNVRTTAVKDGDHYVLNGQKTFITNGIWADFVIVVAKTQPDAGSKGLSLICLETQGLEGYRRGRNLEKIGLKASDTAELFF